MAGLINAVIIGNIGGNAEARQVGERYAVSFSLAVSENYTDKNGQKQERTTWLRCTVWTKNATYASYLTKGQQVCVLSNRIEARAFNGQNGPQASLEVTASSVKLLGPKQQDAAQPTAQTKPVANTPQDDDDLPDFLKD